MSSHEVEAVWFFRYKESHFKALYGRRLERSGDQSYTKDFLQVSGKCKAEFERIIGRSLSLGEEELFIYRWPGSQMEGGKIRHTTDRLSLRWPTSGNAPAPWRMAMNLNSDSLETFEGDPDRHTTVDADEEWNKFNTKNQDPWLVVVKLKGESGILHLRAYLGNPPPHLEHCATAQLPKVVLTAMNSLSGSSACDVVSLSDQPDISPALGRLLDALQANPNVLLIGPPGTGKTVLLEQLARLVEHGRTTLWFDPDRNHDAFSESLQAPGKTRTVVLHPSYSYENLVLGLLPTSGQNGGVSVQVTPGPLINLAHYASEPGARALLVLDEFNRGNAAAVLGDFLAVLDADKRRDIENNQEGATVDLPYSNLEIHVPSEFAANDNTRVSPRFSLPKALWIAAAMNSSDRSVAPLDAAMRRRFSIIYMPPDYQSLRTHLSATNSPLPPNSADWDADNVCSFTVLLLERLNDRLEAVMGQDFLLGQSNFWDVGGEARDEVVASLARAIDERVLPTLRMMFADQDEALAVVLAAGSSETSSTTSNPKRLCYWSAPRADLGAYGYPRLRFNPLSNMATNEVIDELRRLAGV